MIDWSKAPHNVTGIMQNPYNNDIAWCDGDRMILSFGNWKRGDHWYHIAKRPKQQDEQTERKTVEDGQEWTHVRVDEKCRIIVAEPDSDGCIVALGETTGYFTDLPKNLKPIKPTITKAQAWDTLVERAEKEDADDVLSDILANYDVID